jgi:lipopolysaccharide biosynthesis regulator YciM
MGRWEDAAQTQGRIDRLAGSNDTRLLASLWAECGKEAYQGGDAEAAMSCYRRALDLDPGYAPAHLGIGDCLADQDTLPQALEHWQKALENGAAWAIEALDRISAAASAAQDWQHAESACARVLERQPHSWRVQLVLARMHRERGDLDAARDALVKALTEKPGSITVQRELWEVLDAEGASGNAVGDLFGDVVGQARLVDPYVCLECGFKATRPFARCPHCHAWNTVADEQS